MWNPFRTLTERDSARLRKVERQIDDLTADIERCIAQVDRLNARLRTRAYRADRSSDISDDRIDGDGPDFVMPTPVGEVASSDQISVTHSQGPSMSKEELRARARARGLLRA